MEEEKRRAAALISDTPDGQVQPAESMEEIAAADDEVHTTDLLSSKDEDVIF